MPTPEDRTRQKIDESQRMLAGRSRTSRPSTWTRQKEWRSGTSHFTEWLRLCGLSALCRQKSRRSHWG